MAPFVYPSSGVSVQFIWMLSFGAALNCQIFVCWQTPARTANTLCKPHTKTETRTKHCKLLPKTHLHPPVCWHVTSAGVLCGTPPFLVNQQLPAWRLLLDFVGNAHSSGFGCGAGHCVCFLFPFALWVFGQNCSLDSLHVYFLGLCDLFWSVVRPELQFRFFAVHALFSWVMWSYLVCGSLSILSGKGGTSRLNQYAA